MIIGYSTRHSLALDIDNSTLSKVIKLTLLLQREYPILGDSLITLSTTNKQQLIMRYSKNNKIFYQVKGCNYHIITDNIIGYNKVVEIQTILEDLNIINKGHSSIRKYYGDTTIRISPQFGKFISKPIPKPIKYISNKYSGKSDGCIEEYLNLLKMVRHLFYPSNQIMSLSPFHLRL